MNRCLKVLLSLSIAGLVAACGGGDDDDRPSSNIVEVAADEGFTAFVVAATKAGLADELADPDAGVTVFVPTDEAFTALATQLGFADSTEMVDALSADALRSILTYHMLPTEESAAELLTDDGQPTLYEFESAPTELELDFEGDDIVIVDEVETESSVIDSDILASNGTLHSVDKVLIPPGVLTIVQMAQVNPQLASLVSALTGTDLEATLGGSGEFTLFAPTNDAFTAAAAALGALTAEQLATVLNYHVVDDEIRAAEIVFATPIGTRAGQNLTINEADPPTITDTSDEAAEIIETDMRASNGVIHVVDKVLMPAL